MVCEGSQQHDAIRLVDVVEFGMDCGEIVSEPLGPSRPKAPQYQSKNEKGEQQ